MRWLLTILFLGIIVMGARAEYLGNVSIDGVDYNITVSGGNSVLIGNISLEGSDWNVSIMGGIDSSVLGNSDTIVYFGFLDNPTETEGGADTTPPELVVTEPQSTNYSYPNISIDFEVSLDFGDCWYELNNAPLQNISCVTNTTFNATIGENNISINVNDTSNNINQSNITFEMYNETPIITFDSNTSTTTTVSINFNTSVVANSSIDLGNNDYPDLNNFNITHYDTITGLTASTTYAYNITACTKTSLCSRLENLSITTASEAGGSGGGGGGGGGAVNYTLPSVICRTVSSYYHYGIDVCANCRNDTLVWNTSSISFTCYTCADEGFYYNPETEMCELFSKKITYTPPEFTKQLDKVKPEYLVFGGTAFLAFMLIFGYRRKSKKPIKKEQIKKPEQPKNKPKEPLKFRFNH